MEERNLNEKESLELISQMIQNTQQRIRRHNGMPFLVWGYVSIVVSVAVWYLLKTTQDYHWNYLWFLIPLIGYPTTIFLLKKQEKGMKTYIDKVINYIWISLGTASMIVTVCAVFFYSLPVFFIMLLFVGAGTAMTAMITRFKLMIYIGFICMLSSTLFLFPVVKGIDQILLFGTIFFVFMVIPGHILYSKKDIDNV